jgi:hypothetical protein
VRAREREKGRKSERKERRERDKRRGYGASREKTESKEHNKMYLKEK